MEIKTPKNITTIKRFSNIINHGLLLFGIRNRLANLGFDINPYYWVQEEVEECNEPKIKGDSTDFKLRNIDIEEFEKITNGGSNSVIMEMTEGLKKGQQCIGLEYHGEIAAYMFIEKNDFVYNKRKFKLKENEAYLLNMWTFHSYRSKNLAPYLRYQSYQLLKTQGINKKYSITQYFNKSSIKFKKKLNSKHIKLYLSIVFFKKFYWNFLLKDYK